MKRLRLSSLSLGLLLSTAAAGCVASDQPTEQEYDDIAQGVSLLVSDGAEGGDVGSMNDSIDLALAQPPAGFSLEGSGTYEGDRGALQYEYSIECDGGDVCSSETDSAAIQVEWSGELQAPRWNVSVNRTGSWTLDDLQSGTARFNGEGTFSLESHFEAAEREASRSYLFDYAASYSDVLIDMEAREAVGGTATFDIYAARSASNDFRDLEAEFDVHAELTFNGDGTATLVLDGSHSYVLSLASGTVVSS